MAGGLMGGGRHRPGRYRPLAEINVTPLVDVMLVLLIIFMVTAPLMSSAVNIDLPKVATSPVNQDSQPLTISVDAQGQVFLQNDKVELPDLVAKLQASPQYKNMVIVITYDENGGAWDHATPPKGDWVGPGTRIPAIIISPFAKKGTVDHTQYDTASVLRLMTRTFGLDTLPGLKLRDDSLVKNGGKAMGDLTNALNL